MAVKTVDEVFAKRQTSQQRRQRQIYAKKRARRGGKRLVQRRLSSKAKRAAKLRGKMMKRTGLAKKISRFHASHDLPATIKESTTLKHHREFIAAVNSAALEFKKLDGVTNEDVREFAMHFLTKEPVYSNTSTGAAALLYEIELEEKLTGLAQNLVETVVEPSSKSFLIVFDRRIGQKEFEQMEEQMEDRADFDLLINAGQRDDEGTVSDLAIIEAFPKGNPEAELKDNVRFKKAAGFQTGAEKKAALPAQGPTDRTTANNESLSNGAFRVLYPDARIDERNNLAGVGNDLWEYDPEANLWSPVVENSDQVHGIVAVASPDGTTTYVEASSLVDTQSIDEGVKVKKLSSSYAVTVPAAIVRDWKDNWPGSRMPAKNITFTFNAKNGDLEDIEPSVDGEDVVALSHDAGYIGAKKLGLTQAANHNKKYSDPDSAEVLEGIDEAGYKKQTPIKQLKKGDTVVYDGSAVGIAFGPYTGTVLDVGASPGREYVTIRRSDGSKHTLNAKDAKDYTLRKATGKEARAGYANMANDLTGGKRMREDVEDLDEGRALPHVYTLVNDKFKEHGQMKSKELHRLLKQAGPLNFFRSTKPKSEQEVRAHLKRIRDGMSQKTNEDKMMLRNTAKKQWMAADKNKRAKWIKQANKKYASKVSLEQARSSWKDLDADVQNYMIGQVEEAKGSDQLYLENEIDFRSSYCSWIATKDENSIVTIRENDGTVKQYAVDYNESDIAEVLLRAAETYRGLPAEFDTTVQAFLREMCETEGYEQTIEESANEEAEKTAWCAFIAARDRKVAENNRMRRLALGIDAVDEGKQDGKWAKSEATRRLKDNERLFKKVGDKAMWQEWAYSPKTGAVGMRTDPDGDYRIVNTKYPMYGKADKVTDWKSVGSAGPDESVGEAYKQKYRVTPATIWRDSTLKQQSAILKRLKLTGHGVTANADYSKIMSAAMQAGKLPKLEQELMRLKEAFVEIDTVSIGEEGEFNKAKAMKGKFGLFRWLNVQGDRKLKKKGTLDALNKWAQQQGMEWVSDPDSLFGGHWRKGNVAYTFDITEDGDDPDDYKKLDEGFQHVEFRGSKPVKVKTKTANGVKLMQGRTFDDMFAVHTDADGVGAYRYSWTVTHIPSGFGVKTQIDTGANAVKLAKALGKIDKSLWDFTDPKDANMKELGPKVTPLLAKVKKAKAVPSAVAVTVNNNREWFDALLARYAKEGPPDVKVTRKEIGDKIGLGPTTKIVKALADFVFYSLLAKSVGPKESVEAYEESLATPALFNDTGDDVTQEVGDLNGLISKWATVPEHRLGEATTGGPVFDAPTDKDKKDQLGRTVSNELAKHVPWHKVNVSTLGGAERASVMVTVSLDDPKDWANKILQNSRYANFSIDRNGTTELFSGGRKLAKFRKYRAKTLDAAVKKIIDWADKSKDMKVESADVEAEYLELDEAGGYRLKASDKKAIDAFAKGEEAEGKSVRSYKGGDGTLYLVGPFSSKKQPLATSKGGKVTLGTAFGNVSQTWMNAVKRATGVKETTDLEEKAKPKLWVKLSREKGGWFVVTEKGTRLSKKAHKDKKAAIRQAVAYVKSKQEDGERVEILSRKDEDLAGIDYTVVSETQERALDRYIDTVSTVHGNKVEEFVVEAVTPAEIVAESQRIDEARYDGAVKANVAEAEPLEPLKRHYDRWVKRGNTFSVSGPIDVKENITRSAYRLQYGMGNVDFVRVQPKTDELYRYESSVIETVLAEVDRFWDLKEKYDDIGLRHTRGVLMYGPPGCGKSCAIQQMTEMIVGRGDVVFFADNVALLRRGLKEFREVEPDRKVVVVLEDMDEYIGRDEREMLQLLDGDNAQESVLFLGTTNYAERFPPRLLRSGRFDKKIYVGEPEEAAREAYLSNKLKETDKKTIKKLVQDSKGMNFGDLKELVVATHVFKENPNEAVKRIRGAALQESKEREPRILRSADPSMFSTNLDVIFEGDERAIQTHLLEAEPALVGKVEQEDPPANPKQPAESGAGKYTGLASAYKVKVQFEDETTARKAYKTLNNVSLAVEYGPEHTVIATSRRESAGEAKLAVLDYLRDNGFTIEESAIDSVSIDEAKLKHYAVTINGKEHTAQPSQDGKAYDLFLKGEFVKKIKPDKESRRQRPGDLGSAAFLTLTKKYGPDNVRRDKQSEKFESVDESQMVKDYFDFGKMKGGVAKSTGEYTDDARKVTNHPTILAISKKLRLIWGKLEREPDRKKRMEMVRAQMGPSLARYMKSESQMDEGPYVIGKRDSGATTDQERHSHERMQQGNEKMRKSNRTRRNDKGLHVDTFGANVNTSYATSFEAVDDDKVSEAARKSLKKLAGMSASRGRKMGPRKTSVSTKPINWNTGDYSEEMEQWLDSISENGKNAAIAIIEAVRSLAIAESSVDIASIAKRHLATDEGKRIVGSMQGGERYMLVRALGIDTDGIEEYVGSPKRAPDYRVAKKDDRSSCEACTHSEWGSWCSLYSFEYQEGHTCNDYS